MLRALVWLSVFLLGFVAQAVAQEDVQDEIDPAEARAAWLEIVPGVSIAAAPYTLSKAEQDKFKGTFGIDLSHYSFDTGSHAKKCKTQDGYLDPACSCSANWDAVSDNGIRYVYSKATDATAPDLSFNRFWADLEARHSSKRLFRGAFHFLRPGVDAEKQAAAFLNAIGAVGGKKPQQLPPVLDIEWASKLVAPESQEFKDCPADRISHDQERDRYLCDMWHRVSRENIAQMAKVWIDRVEAATGKPVILYTNPAWWNLVMQEAGEPLMAKQAVWTSRYTSKGPQYNQVWNKQGGSEKWGMAPLPRGASYPDNSYNVAHSWQFTEAGFLSQNVFACAGVSTRRAMDMDWLPVRDVEFDALFKAGD